MTRGQCLDVVYLLLTFVYLVLDFNSISVIGAAPAEPLFVTASGYPAHLSHTFPHRHLQPPPPPHCQQFRPR